PHTGGAKARGKPPSPNGGGAVARAGGLVFKGGTAGPSAAYDGRTRKELWSFDAGTGTQAPPITFSINGKQYVAVLAGARQNPVIINQYPELKNTSPASMLYVFGL